MLLPKLRELDLMQSITTPRWESLSDWIKYQKLQKDSKLSLPSHWTRLRMKSPQLKIRYRGESVEIYWWRQTSSNQLKVLKSLSSIPYSRHKASKLKGKKVYPQNKARCSALSLVAEWSWAHSPMLVDKQSLMLRKLTRAWWLSKTTLIQTLSMSEPGLAPSRRFIIMIE